MAYDGKVMRLALQRFEEDRQRRQAQYQERRERIFARQPRLLTDLTRCHTQRYPVLHIQSDLYPLSKGSDNRCLQSLSYARLQ